MNDAERIKIILCAGKVNATLLALLNRCSDLDAATLTALPLVPVLNHLDRMVALTDQFEVDVLESLERFQLDLAATPEQKAG